MKVFLLLMLFFCFNVFSQDDYRGFFREIAPDIHLSGEDYRLLRNDLRLNTLIIESVKEIQLSGGEIQNIDNVTSNLQRTILNALESKSFQLGEPLGNQAKEALRRGFSLAKFKEQIQKMAAFARENLASRGVSISNYTRRFGISTGLYYLCAMQLDFTLPMILMATGNVKVGATLLSVPFSSTTTTMFASLKSAGRYRHLIKEMGFQSSQENFTIFRKMKRFFDRSLMSTDYLVDINIAGQRTVLTIEESNLISRTLNKLGYRNSLNFTNLKSFLQENGKFDTLINTLPAQSGQQQLAMTLKMLKEIELSGDLDLIGKLKSRFGNKINLIEGLDIYDTHKNWFTKLASSTDMNQVFKVMREIPEDIAPRTFSKVWKSYVLPELSISFGSHTSKAHYTAFRQLNKLWDSEMMPKFLPQNGYNMTAELKKLTLDYLYEGFGPLGSCGMILKGPRMATLNI